MNNIPRMFFNIACIVVFCLLSSLTEGRHKHLRHPQKQHEEKAIRKQSLENQPISKALSRHNLLREKHHSEPLKLSQELSVEAQKLAQAMALKSTLDVPMDRSMFAYGENVAKLSAGAVSNCDDAGEAATNIWYSQVQNYSYGDPRLNEFTDTFTQVVWKDSKQIGIGCAQTPGPVDGAFYVVALYNPPGNIPRFLRSNVFSTKPLHKLEDVYSSVFRKNTVKKKNGVARGVLK